MKKIVFLFALVLFVQAAFSQKQQLLYDENADAVKQIAVACKQAAKSDKYVLCQVGGNWCPWCSRFAQFVKTDSTINQVIEDNFIYIHVNYSKNNKNPKAMEMLGNPARFGFPVLVVLDAKKHVLHIQNSAYLEEGSSYNAAKVLEFFQQWTPTAVKTLK